MSDTPRTDALWKVTRNQKNPKVMSYARPPGTEAYDLSCALERELSALKDAQQDMVSVPVEPTDRQVEEGELLLRIMLEEKTSLDVRLIYRAMISTSKK